MTTPNFDIHYTPGIDNDPALEAANMDMAKVVTHRLMQFYPGHFWAVNADIAHGVINIFNMHISTTHGYVLIVHDWLKERVVADDVIRAGGEILERAGMRRGRFDAAEYAALPRDFKGDVIVRN